MFEDGWLEDSMVASKLGLLMWITDNVHREKLDDQLIIREQRPHENPLLAVKGHMQYRWLRAKMREQDIVKQEKMEVNAQVAVETGKDFDNMVAQVMDHRESNFKSKGQKKLPKPPKDDVIKLNQKQQHNSDWTNDAKTAEEDPPRHRDLPELLGQGQGHEQGPDDWCHRPSHEHHQGVL